MSKKKPIIVEIFGEFEIKSVKQVQAEKNAIDNNNNAGQWPQTASIMPLIDEHQLVGKKNYNKRTDDM